MINFERVKEYSSECASCVIKPCQVGCPLNNDITEFIKLVKDDDYKKAYEVLSNTTVLPSICGRICPHDSQCQGSCVKRISHEAVKIGLLEAIVGDLAIKNNYKLSVSNKKLGKKVLVIGGGPAGLTCAAFLQRNGVDVTIYEKYDYLGGILRHGIPEFRLDKEILGKSIQRIIDLGVYVKFDMELGKSYQLSDVVDKYDAVFLGIGANKSLTMNIPGEDLDGVYGGNELLEHNTHPDYIGKTVIVSGGGNVAMDVCRTIKKKGANKVYVIYRRSEQEMPAEKIEIQDAKDEGIEFLFKNNIVQILGDKKVEKIECIRTSLVKDNDNDRAKPVNIEGSNYYIDCDYVIMAVGSKVEEGVVNSLGIELNDRGKIKIDKDGRTSNPKVFAGGDVAGTKGTVAFAARAGRNSADAILNMLKNHVK